MLRIGKAQSAKQLNLICLMCLHSLLQRENDPCYLGSLILSTARRPPLCTPRLVTTRRLPASTTRRPRILTTRFVIHASIWTFFPCTVRMSLQPAHCHHDHVHFVTSLNDRCLFKRSIFFSPRWFHRWKNDVPIQSFAVPAHVDFTGFRFTAFFSWTMPPATHPDNFALARLLAASTVRTPPIRTATARPHRRRPPPHQHPPRLTKRPPPPRAIR
jgi:hypothetical protein